MRACSFFARCTGLLLVPLALAACGGGGDDERSSPVPTALPDSGLVALDAGTSCHLPDFRATLLQQINAARAEARTCGTQPMPAVGPLAWEDRLFSAAARHSDDMARHRYFSHTGRDGRTPGQRVSAEGYRWWFVGENIAAGQTSASSVMAAWLASPGHCENLMRPQYTEVGVACVLAPSGSPYGRYWTMKLARP